MDQIAKTEEITNISRIAKHYARRWGCAHIAEEVSQEVLLLYVSILKSKTRRTIPTVKQMTIDCLRNMGPYRRNGSQDPLDASTGTEGLLSWLEDTRGTETPRRVEESLPRGISREERAILVLHYVWGLTEKEISFCFGMSHGWAHQILIQFRLRGVR